MYYVLCRTVTFKLEERLQDPGGIGGVELGVASKISFSCYLKLFRTWHLYTRFHFGKVLLTTALKSSHFKVEKSPACPS